jgi:hypothetical protein
MRLGALIIASFREFLFAMPTAVLTSALDNLDRNSYALSAIRCCLVGVLACSHHLIDAARQNVSPFIFQQERRLLRDLRSLESQNEAGLLKVSGY